MVINHRVADWMSAGVALGAVLLAAGCSSSAPASRQASAPEPTPLATGADPATPPHPVSMSAPLPDAHAINPLPGEAWPEVKVDRGAPSLINVFGEVAGVPQRRLPVSSDASFQQHTSSDEGYDGDVALDPSGKWLAFSSTRHSDHSDVYLQRVDGTSVVQLTTDPADDAQPAFSPDGKHVAFCSTRSGNWDIYLMDIDGKSVQQVTNTPGHEMHPSFSPDGTKLVYCSLSPRSDQWELWTVDLSTQARRMIGHGLFPVWSPNKDADRIAFQKARQRGSRWFSLWTVDLVEGEPRRLTEVTVSSNFAVLTPSWSPDGSRLTFAGIAEPDRAGEPQPQAREGEVPAEGRGKQDVWIVSADGAGRQKLTDGTGINSSPFWGADNRIYFISDRGGKENVWSVRAEPGSALMANKPMTPAAPHATVGSTDASEVGK